MTTGTIEKELLELETLYWQAVKDKDSRTVARLSDDPCIVTGASGMTKIDRRTMASMVEAPTWKLNRFEVKPDAQVRLLGKDVAILAYNVHEELTVDGKPVVLEASDASVWRRDGKEWVCSLHTEALEGDAFGRDRKAV